LARREHYALGIMLAARWLTIPFTMVESPPPSSSPTASPRPGVWSAMRQAGRTSSSSPHDASARPRWRCARDQLTQHKVLVAYADLFRAIHAHGVIGVNRQPTPPGGGVDQDAAEEQARDELERTRVGSAARVRSQHEVVAAHQHDYRKEAVREPTTQTGPAMPAHPGANCALV